MAINTYSFASFSCYIAGPNGSFNLSAGNTEGGISFSRRASKNTLTVGADGRGQNALHAENSGTITVRLLKTSPANAMLQAMYDSDRSNPSVWGQNVITGRDTNLGDNHTGNLCAFQKFPDVVYDKEGAALEWVFDVADLQSNLGAGGF